MARITQPPQQFQSVHAGKVGIDHQARLAAGTIVCKECLARRIILDVPAIVFEHLANRRAHLVVVVDDEDHRRPRLAGRLGGARRGRLHHGVRESAADAG